MRSVQVTLISDSLEEFKMNTKRHNFIWWLIVGFFIVLQIPIVTVQYWRKFGMSRDLKDIISDEIYDRLELVELILRSLKMPIDIYMFVLYMRLLHFFTQFKLAKMRANLIRFTCKNKMTIVFAFLVGVLAFETSIMQVVYLFGVYFFSDSEENDINTVYDFEKKIVWPFIDFLMATGILFIFYSIGMQKYKNEKAGNMINGFDLLNEDHNSN